MTPAVAVLDRALRLGVRVEPNGPKLRASAPPELAEAEWAALLADLAEHKAGVLEALAAPPTESPPYRRPAELATWPIPKRERWGRRSEAFELAGVAWPESERWAFAEVRDGLDQVAVPSPDPAPAPLATAGRPLS